MRFANLAALGLLLSAAAPGCRSADFTSVSQLTSVTTLVDSQSALKNARTFALPDTIVHVLRGEGELGRAGDAEILTRIRQGFLAMGWREVTDVRAQRPDVVVLTAAIEETHVGTAYSDWWGAWGYWPGWPAGYGADWGWGYPTAVTFTYETGTLLITMLDLRDGDPTTKRVPLLWAAGVNAVLTASSVDVALAGIDQAFAQSLYLQRP